MFTGSRTVFAITLLVCSLMLVACGGRGDGSTPSPPPPTSNFLVVANSNDPTIEVFSYDPSVGRLATAAIAQTRGTDVAQPGFDTGRNLLFSVDRLSSTIEAFSFDRVSARLTPVGTPSPAGVNPPQAIAHSNGRIYVSNAHAVSVFRFESNQFARDDDFLISGSNNPYLLLDPSGKFLFVADGDSGAILTTRINSTGGLDEVSQARLSNTATGLIIQIDPTGQFLYVADFVAKTIISLHINGSGVLDIIPGSVIATGDQLQSLTVRGNCLYGASFSGFNLNEPRIWGYKINTDGTLTTAPGFPMRVGTLPQGVALSQSGWLFVTDFGFPGTQDPRGYLHVFSVNSSTCAVTQAAGSPYRTGLGPQSMVVIE